MKILPSSIVMKYVLVVVATVTAVSVAGFGIGRVLLAKMAALGDDQAVTEALRLGQETAVEFRDARRAWVEAAARNCRDLPGGSACPVPGLNLDASAAGKDAKAGWESEDSFVIDGPAGPRRLALRWSPLKPRYQAISDVINTREHVSMLYPSVENSFLGVFALAVTFFGVLGVASVYLLSRRLGRRVSTLTDYAAQLSSGELLPAPAAAIGADEIGLLAAAMQKMARDLAKAQEHLMYAQKVSSWQAMARKVAHEIKNPLTPITIVAEQLQRLNPDPGAGPGLKETLNEAARVLHDEAGALARMVREFSAFARLPEPALEHCDLAAVTADFIARNQRPGGPSLIMAPNAVPCWVMADRRMLIQVLHNLVNNAVLAKAPQRAAITFSVSQSAKTCALDVADDGPGVPEDLRATLFDAYVTSRSTGDGEKGMGLGLTISRKIAMDHRGTLNLQTSGPDGSCFRLALPAAAFGGGDRPVKG